MACLCCTRRRQAEPDTKKLASQAEPDLEGAEEGSTDEENASEGEEEEEDGEVAAEASPSIAASDRTPRRPKAEGVQDCAAGALPLSEAARMAAISSAAAKAERLAESEGGSVFEIEVLDDEDERAAEDEEDLDAGGLASRARTEKAESLCSRGPGTSHLSEEEAQHSPGADSFNPFDEDGPFSFRSLDRTNPFDEATPKGSHTAGEDSTNPFLLAATFQIAAGRAVDTKVPDPATIAKEQAEIFQFFDVDIEASRPIAQAVRAASGRLDGFDEKADPFHLRVGGVDAFGLAAGEAHDVLAAAAVNPFDEEEEEEDCEEAGDGEEDEEEDEEEEEKEVVGAVEVEMNEADIVLELEDGDDGPRGAEGGEELRYRQEEEEEEEVEEPRGREGENQAKATTMEPVAARVPPRGGRVYIWQEDEEMERRMMGGPGGQSFSREREEVRGTAVRAGLEEPPHHAEELVRETSAGAEGEEQAGQAGLAQPSAEGTAEGSGAEEGRGSAQEDEGEPSPVGAAFRAWADAAEVSRRRRAAEPAQPRLAVGDAADSRSSAPPRRDEAQSDVAGAATRSCGSAEAAPQAPVPSESMPLAEEPAATVFGSSPQVGQDAAPAAAAPEEAPASGPPEEEDQAPAAEARRQRLPRGRTTTVAMPRDRAAEELRCRCVLEALQSLARPNKPRPARGRVATVVPRKDTMLQVEEDEEDEEEEEKEDGQCDEDKAFAQAAPSKPSKAPRAAPHALGAGPFSLVADAVQEEAFFHSEAPGTPAPNPAEGALASEAAPPAQAPAKLACNGCEAVAPQAALPSTLDGKAAVADEPAALWARRCWYAGATLRAASEVLPADNG